MTISAIAHGDQVAGRVVALTEDTLPVSTKVPESGSV
jgi:hypothetical protein